MDAIEIASFLDEQSTGVLSLADDSDAYAVPVSFVVYDLTDDGWKSVVVRGRTEAVSKTTLGTSILETVEDLDIPCVRAHDHAGEQLDFSVVRIDATSVSGVVAPR
jgi:nitroimidazol reductase NimA-like FMN-containing flavoprotein (pyridoxamine 5'-phosphate oxidase superfamily)